MAILKKGKNKKTMCKKGQDTKKIKMQKRVRYKKGKMLKKRVSTERARCKKKKEGKIQKREDTQKEQDTRVILLRIPQRLISPQFEKIKIFTMQIILRNVIKKEISKCEC